MNHTSGSDFKSQSELIEELRKRQQFRFQLSVYLSWLSLLIILLFAFSGLEAQFLGIQIRTIKLDFQFIRRHTPFIAGGIGLTILLSFFSVILASCFLRCARSVVQDSICLCFSDLLHIPNSWNSTLVTDYFLLSRIASVGHTFIWYGSWNFSIRN